MFIVVLKGVSKNTLLIDKGMFAVLTAYIFPLVLRFMRTEEWHLDRIFLSISPLLILVLPIFLQRIIQEETKEHVYRHALYALAFTVSAGTTFRWHVVYEAFDKESWTRYTLLFVIVGIATLWWFVVAHMIENKGGGKIFTHQGDVTVLPLTLVAIATFVYQVPNEAFQFSRSIPFYVPIIVAWASMYFIAYNNFATSKTTTLHVDGFYFLAESSAYVAVVHLALIEMRATPSSFIFFTLVSSIFSQLSPRSLCPPKLRQGHELGLCIVAGVLGATTGTLLHLRFEDNRIIWYNILIASLLPLWISRVCGQRWVIPASLFGTLLLATVVATDSSFSEPLHVYDIVAMLALFILAFQITEIIAQPLDVQTDPPSNAPSARPCPSKTWWWLRMLQRLETIPVCGNRKHGDELMNELLTQRNQECPEAFSGVWYMHDSGMPMQLLTVHQHRWNVDRNTRFSMLNGVRPANLAGCLNAVSMSLCTTEIQERGSRWIRTPTWCLGFFKLIPRTEWFYRVHNDLLLRVSYDHEGFEVFRYEMRRICKGNGRRTTYYREFMDTFSGTACLKI